IGASANPPGFDAELTGLTAGQQKTFDVNYPADYAIKELAGTMVSYDVTIKAIRKRIVPALDDEFAKDLGDFASLDALIVARKNAALVADALHSPVEFRPGSLLAPVRDLRPRLIVSNPPYVAFDEIRRLPASVRDWEPPAALLSGSQGLAATAAIVQEGASLLEAGGILALEVNERRASIVAEMMMSTGNYIDVGVRLDLTGRERFVFASRA
ncbi:MAG: hypothetical protein ABR582_15550, partial [Gemmatimonadaceae bacterium]